MLKNEKQNKIRVEILGLTVGSSMYFPPLSAIELFISMLHEAGHVLAKKLSARNEEILTPDKVKGTVVIFSDEEYRKLAWHFLFGWRLKEIPEVFFPVIRRLLDFYAKGNFDVYSLKFTMCNTEEFANLVKKHKIETIKRDSDGNIILTSTRKGRDIEIPAIATEEACLRLLMYEASKITRISAILSMILHITTTKATEYQKSSHGRAWKIVDRAYNSRRWVLPTDLDKAK
ncbi:MAG: hypothetical protein HZA34_01755 [Candidatus Pacebacteria bacterium]|nr:hypothetical protein [Candidatus Paceibacterota bacterium]